MIKIIVLQKLLHFVYWLKKWFKSMDYAFISLWTQSFRHNHFLIINQNHCFTKVATFCLLVLKVWIRHSFCYKCSHFITTIFWYLIKLIALQKMLHFVHWLRKVWIMHSFCHKCIHFVITFFDENICFTKVATFCICL